MKQGVNAVILNEKEEVLLLRRADGKFKGCLTMPGGKVEPGETLSEAMIREVKEETNLDVIGHQFINKFYFPKIDVEVGIFFAQTSGTIDLDLRESSEYFYIKPSKENVDKYFDQFENHSPEVIHDIFNSVNFFLKSRKKLLNLSNQSNVFFTDRGNRSINLALKLAKNLGKTKAFIQDQGGWITYEQYLKKIKFDYHFLDTDYGVVSLDIIKKHIDSDSVLLINSMPGYFAVQDNMDKVAKLCREKGCLLINDVAGSIGTEQAKYGDIIIGSFGRWKPLNLEYGGFISFNEKEYSKFLSNNFDKELKEFYPELLKQLNGLDKRREAFLAVSKKIKTQLSQYDVIHKDHLGYNVIVRYSSPKEKLDIMNYCKLYNYEYTLCPRYIRVMDDAISIEVKRL
jgi:mutator protein MutT